MSRVAVLMILCLALSACAARGILTVMPDVQGEEATVQEVFVATNRLRAARSEDGLFQQHLGEQRNPELRFVRLGVSVPKGHVPGQIEWPGSQLPDPAQHFVVTREQTFDTAATFVRAVDAAGGAQQEVVVFVHGYNVNNAEAVYRLAQIAHDFDAKLPVIAYSWPSAGHPRGYVYDRDSVIFSRDGLEQLLTDLTQGNQRKILIVGHSMGGQLVMETLRQMSIAGKGHIIGRLSGVALISPDIDEDVFLQQAQRIKPFPEPFMLMVSTRDRVLNFAASILTGKPSRLGSIDNPERLASLPIQVIDLSDIPGGDVSGHSTAFTAPAAITLLRGLATSN